MKIANVSNELQFAYVFIYGGQRYVTLPLSSIQSFKVKNFIPEEKKYKILWQNRFVEEIVLAIGGK